MGGLADSFWVMLAGRVVFSVGGENLAVCQNNYAVKWFKGKELNTVFGVQLSFARIVRHTFPTSLPPMAQHRVRVEGSTVNMYSMGAIYTLLQHAWPAKPAYFWLGMTLLLG